MARITIMFAAIACLGACSPAPDQAHHNAAVTVAAPPVPHVEAPVRRAERAAEAAPAPRPARRRVEREPEPLDLCWQDYCPCEPPRAGPDRRICRQLRAGMRVDDQVMAAGARKRRARQPIIDLEAVERGQIVY